MALTQISTEGIKNGTITGSDLATNVDLVDNQKLRFGTGNDLEIYFNGTNSVIAHVPNSGDLILQAPTGETSIRCNASSSVDLYYDNNKKFETTSTGATLTGVLATDSVDISSSGNLSLPDNRKIYIGTGNDTRVYHNGADLYIDNDTGGTWIGLDSGATFGVGTGPAASPQALKAVIGAQVELMHNGTKKFDTTSYGTRTTGNHTITGQLTLETDGQKAVFGAGDDLQIYHDGSHSDIHDSGSGNLRLRSSKVQILNEAATEQIANFIPDGAVELYYDNSKKFETTSSGVAVTGGLTASGASTFNEDVTFDGNTAGRDMLWDRSRDSLVFKDNAYIELGTGTDLKIYHDGSHSYLDETGTGNLLLKTNGGKVGITTGGGTEIANFVNNGKCELFHAGTSRFETTTNGATIDGGSNVSMDSSGNGQLKVNGSGYSGAIALDGTAMNIYHNSSSRGIVFGINETEVARFSNQGRFYVNRTGELKGGDTISVETTHSGHGGGAYIMSWKGDSDVLSIRNHGSGDYELVNNGGGNELSLYDGSGGARLEYYDNGNYIGMVSDYAASNRAYSRTTSGSANMNVNSSGYMRRSTSSQRYKNNIREYSGKGIEILKNIIPKTWEDHEEGTTHHGFIAEEFHSAGLTTAVLYEPYIGGEEIGIGEEKGDFYGNGTPPVTKTGEALDDEVLVVDGVDQTTILAELVIAVKQLNSRLEALEE